MVRQFGCPCVISSRGAAESVTTARAGIPSMLPFFLEKEKKYVATIYRDAANADWQSNPEAYSIEKFIVNNGTELKIILARGGGAAISLAIATPENLKSVKAYR